VQRQRTSQRAIGRTGDVVVCVLVIDFVTDALLSASTQDDGNNRISLTRRRTVLL
jgi:hypothetical protein